MPGSLGTATGFIYRDLGKGLSSSGALQRMGKGGALAAGGGQISVQFGPQGNGADTTEDVLLTASLPPNTLDIPGRCISLLAWGNVTATNSTLKNARLYFGSIVALAQYATAATGNWQIYMMVWKTANNTQSSLYRRSMLWGHRPPVI